MIGLGTVANVLAILAGGMLGLLSRNFLQERYRETIIKAMGFAIIVMALCGTLSQMLVVKAATGGQPGGILETQGTLMLIVSLAIGALLGEFFDVDKRTKQLGIWLRDKSGNQGDARFIDAFITASLTVCVGAMAIIGAIQDGISGNADTLLAKAILDFIIVLMMAASLGKGCIFSAVPVGIFQGSITVLSHQIAPIMTEAALGNIAAVGNVLILCVGVNLIWPDTIRVANVLPAILIAVAFAVL